MEKYKAESKRQDRFNLAEVTKQIEENFSQQAQAFLQSELERRENQWTE
jgi:hypothetical protein